MEGLQITKNEPKKTTFAREYFLICRTELKELWISQMVICVKAETVEYLL